MVFANRLSLWRLHYEISARSVHRNAKKTVKPGDADDILHRWLQYFHYNYDAEFLFQAQLVENLGEQPVEYAGLAWDEKKYPWQPVAELIIPKQESFSYARKSF